MRQSYSIFLSLALCLLTTPGQAEEPVVLQLKWKHAYQFAGYYMAKEKGYYRTAGLNVELREGGPNVDFVDEVISGRANYATGSTGILLDRNSGKPLVVLGVIFQHSPDVLFVSQASGITHPQQLVGKTVMDSASTPAIAPMLLAETGSLKKFNIIPQDNNYQGLIDGKFDAAGGYTTNETFFYREKQFPVTILKPINYGIDFYGDNLFTSEQELSEHPQRAEAFRLASFKGWEYAMAHPEETIGIIRDYGSTRSPEHLRFEYEAMHELLLPGFVEIGYMNPGRWQHIADTLVKVGQLRPDYTLEGFLYNPSPGSDIQKLKKYLSITIAVTLIAAVVIMVLVLFNRRLKEQKQALHESEARFRHVADTAPIMIWMSDTNKQCIYFNKPWLEFTGRTLEQELGNGWSEGVHPGDYERCLNTYTAAFDARRHFKMEYRLLRHDGEYRWVYDDGVPRYTPDGVFIGYIGSCGDISELIETQQELQRTVRALRVLSHCNEALAKITDEKKLLDTMCRIIIDDGKFLFAWVGYPQQDARKTVKPMAHAGYEAGYLENLITWSESDERGQGPVGRCLRNKEIVVIRNFATDPTLKPWHIPARERGYASIVALPLQLGNDVIGSLTIYAADENAFDDQAVHLLSELANNIALGVHTIRTELSLIESRQKYQMLLESMSDGVLVVQDYRIKYANSAMSKMLGYSHEEFLALEYQDVIAAEFLDQVINDYKLRIGIDPEPHGKYEVRLRCKEDINALWVEFHAQRITLDGKNVLLAIVRDITARKNVEEELRSNTQRQDFLLSSSPAVIYTCKPSGDFAATYITPNFHDEFGYTPEEFLHDPAFWTRNIHPEDVARVVKAFTTLFAQDTLSQQYRFRMPDGSYHWVQDDLRLIRNSDGTPQEIIGAWRDINPIKYSEELHRQNEERLKEAQHIASLGNWELNLVTNLLIWSDEVYRIFEIDKERFNASYETFLTLVHPDDRERVQTAYENSLKTHSAYEITHRLLLPDGRIKWITERCHSYFDENGTPLRSVGTVQDITLQYNTRLELQTGRALTDELFANLQGMVYRCKNDPDWTLEFVTEGITPLTGYTPKEFVEDRSIHFGQLILPEDTQQVWDKVQEALTRREAYDLSYRIRTRAGDIKWVAERGHGVFTDDGQLLYLQGLIIDDTLRVRTEKELLLTQFCLTHAPEAVFWINAEGKTTTVNDLACHTLGYSREELTNMYVWDYDPVFPRENWAQWWANARQSGGHTFETFHRRKNGTVFPVEISSVHMKYQDNELHVAFVRDITERKQAGEALRESEQRFRQLAENIDQVFWMTDPTKNQMLYVSPSYEAIWGRSVQSLYASPLTWLEAIHPEDRERIREAAFSRQSSGDYDEEYRVIRPDGSMRWVHDRAFPVKNKKDEVIRIAGIVEDITSRRQATHDLELAHTAIDKSRSAFFWINLEGKVIYVNDFACQNLGYTREELTGMYIWDFDPDFTPKDLPPALELMRQKGAIVLESRHRRKDGTIFPIEVTANYITFGGVDHIFTFVQDISERKQKDTELQQSRTLLSAIVENLPSMVFLKDANDLKISLLNKAGEELLGIPREQLIGRNDFDLFPREQAQSFTARDQETLQNKTVVDIPEEPVTTTNKGIRILHTRKVGIYDTDQTPRYLLGISEDITERKQAEEAIATLAERLNLAAHAAQFGIWDWYIPGNTLIWDDRMFELYGARKESFEGAYEAWLARVYPDDRARCDEMMQQALRNEKPYDIEFRVQWPDDTIHIIKADGQVVWDTEGRPLRMTGISYDITERKKAEQAIHESEQRLRELLEFSPIAVRIARAGREVVFCNQSYAALVDVDRGGVIGIDPRSYYAHPEDYDRILEELSQGVTIRNRLVELVISREESTWTLASYEPIQYQGENAIIGWFYDITALKKAEQGLRVSEEQLRRMNETLEERVTERARELHAERNFIHSVLETAGALVFVVDRRGHVVRFNRACEKLTGYRFDEIKDRPFWEVLIPPEQAIPLQSMVDNLSSFTPSSRGESEWLTRTGERRLIEWSYSILPDESGQEIAYVIGTGIDITERKKAEESLLQAKEEAEQASVAKSQFLSRMSHELRTPMNAILGFSQLLQMDVQDPGQQDQVHEILRASHHLLDLINELLDLSRIEAGRLHVTLETLNPATVISEAVNLVWPLVEKKNLTLHNQTASANKLPVLADATRLRQVLVNLLSNAAKYNRPGGTIRIDCTLLDDARLRLSVTDTGLGIPPDKQALLFQPFERLGAESGNEDGTGIGLALSKRLVELMGGEIGVKSVDGEGTTVWLSLPRAALPHMDESKTHREINMTKEMHTRVLYVEDNAANLRLVQRVLARYPAITVISAVSGEAGLELARAHHPDVILLDVHLPGIDGYEVLQLLQEDPDTAAIPVIAISADAMPLDIERGIKAGFRYYLTKPINIQELIDTLSKVLPFGHIVGAPITRH